MRDLGFAPGREPASLSEIERAEQVIAQTLPPDLVEFYTTINGGPAELCYFDPGFEYVRIHEFRSLADAMDAYEFGLAKDFLTDDLFPIAHDEGGNYICLGRDGAIYYYVHDLWDASLTIAENQTNARSRVGESFVAFVDGLVTEDEAGAV